MHKLLNYLNSIFYVIEISVRKYAFFLLDIREKLIHKVSYLSELLSDNYIYPHSSPLVAVLLSSALIRSDLKRFFSQGGKSQDFNPIVYPRNSLMELCYQFWFHQLQWLRKST